MTLVAPTGRTTKGVSKRLSRAACRALAVAGTAGLSLLAAGPAAAGSPTAYGLLPVLRLTSLVYRAGSS